MRASKALLIDVGNTRLKWGLLDDGEITRTGRVSHEAMKATGLSALATRLPGKVDAVMVSNVAGPSFATRLHGFIGLHCGVQPQFARATRSACGITSGYRRPRQLGTDRWAAMIGARAETRSAFCVVGVGTAITIDGVDRNGQHLGGQIIPGLHLMAEALRSATNGMRDLKVRETDPGTGMALFANGTARAVLAGALNAICGSIERSVKIMRSNGIRPRLFITGGGAASILKELGIAAEHRPNLVLQGLAVMLDKPS